MLPGADEVAQRCLAPSITTNKISVTTKVLSWKKNKSPPSPRVAALSAL